MAEECNRPTKLECPEGWVACAQDKPCPRHVEYWDRYKNQVPQPPTADDLKGNSVKLKF